MLPLRLAALAVVLLALALGWLYRDRIVSAVRQASGTAAPAAVGRPGPAALREARDEVSRLGRGADSVVLSADEAASLLAAGLDPALRGRLDSLELGLGDGRITAGGVVNVGRLPADLVGPLTVALREHERVALGGPVSLAAAGRAEWTIDEFALRGVPLPREAVPRLVSRAFGDSARRTLAVALPASVRRLRIEPQQVILYRVAQP